jgi:hypothetical protein
MGTAAKKLGKKEGKLAEMYRRGEDNQTMGK